MRRPAAWMPHSSIISSYSLQLFLHTCFHLQARLDAINEFTPGFNRGQYLKFASKGLTFLRAVKAA